MSRVRDFFKSKREHARFNRLESAQRRIVFYAESGQDWHHFEPIVDFLTGDLGRQICYVTSDETDPVFDHAGPNLLPFFIGAGFWQILLFQTLKAEIMVLTVMDLQNMQLKRSVNPVHYAYVFHAMGSTHMVDMEDSYDHYDTVFCVGPHHVREIRKREEQASLPAKQLFEHGYGRLEILMEQGRERQPRSEKGPKTVLLAPTWGEDSILNLCGRDLVKVLLDAGYRVILRPHYQTNKLSPQVVQSILDEFKGNPNLDYVARMGETDSLFDSDLLICDWSSTSMEYSLGLGKPVLFIDVPPRIRNPKYEELGIEPMEFAIRREVGEVLGLQDIERAPEAIERLTADPVGFRTRIDELRRERVFNIGDSGEVGAREIARISDEIATKGKKQ
jgi:hypothetical protein